MTASKIQQTATQLFIEKGYEGTSLAEIAEFVGLKKPSLYNHYKSKDDLFLHIFSNSCQRSILYLNELLIQQKTVTPAQKIAAIYKQLYYAIPEFVPSKFLFRFLSYPPHHLHEECRAISKMYLEASENTVASYLKEQLSISERDAYLISLHLRVILNGLYSDYSYRKDLRTDEEFHYFEQQITNLIEQYQ